MSLPEMGPGGEEVVMPGMEFMMQCYEDELKHPIRNLVSGQLARSLLIQVIFLTFFFCSSSSSSLSSSSSPPPHFDSCLFLLYTVASLACYRLSNHSTPASLL